jgi:hypothetical protein
MNNFREEEETIVESLKQVPITGIPFLLSVMGDHLW